MRPTRVDAVFRHTPFKCICIVQCFWIHQNDVEALLQTFSLTERKVQLSSPNSTMWAGNLKLQSQKSIKFRTQKFTLNFTLQNTKLTTEQQIFQLPESKLCSTVTMYSPSYSSSATYKHTSLTITNISDARKFKL